MSRADGPLVVLGDALLDIDLRGAAREPRQDGQPPVLEEPAAWHRPGGAALAAWLAARDGHPVVLATALGDDTAGGRLADLLRDAVTLVRLPLRGATPTKSRVQAGERTLLRVDTGAGHADPADPHRRAADAVRAAGAVLVSDYGRGMAALPEVRAALAEVTGSVPVVWDPHPRGPVPVPGCWLVTPNAREAGVADADADAPAPGAGRAAATRARRRAAEMAAGWGARSSAVTLGGHGAAWAPATPAPAATHDGTPDGRYFPPPRQVPAADACGAGDRLAACAAGALHAGAGPADAVAEGVQAASRFVERGAAGTAASPGPLAGALPLGLGESAGELAERVRRSGGRVVATGGCFDVLHAGHVSLLRRARALGDCLVVCVNDDAAARARKGPGRPVCGVRDRVRVLSALDCVDAVTVFDDLTPAGVIARLRPDVWVKGGDYADTPTDLPEADLVRGYGGEVTILPLLPGRSTTRLVAGQRRSR